MVLQDRKPVDRTESRGVRRHLVHLELQLSSRFFFEAEGVIEPVPRGRPSVYYKDMNGWRMGIGLGRE